MKNNQHFIIGITGGIGSGKTTAANFFEELGIPVYNSDIRAKLIQNEDIDVKNKIIALLGTNSYNEYGLNRDFVSNEVFNDKQKLVELNKIVHPAVFDDFEQWKINQTSKIIMKEAAILIESGSYKTCDVVINVIVDINIRIARILERDPLSEAEIMKRINNQISDEERISKSDYIIYNNSNLSDLKNEVQKTLLKIKKEYNI
ncbi:dephospho-CoA kinase [Chishuiella sp.]|uniref:dephospho-CoA kinase n=1 Tax=Chishuiella sp. TaxID=1969467 RepID=UPI0028A87CF3|nr:dephospho-CoA kinase [Chishuiella sp.]